jgi:hypothetical protein
MPEDSDYYDSGPAAGTEPNPAKPGSDANKPGEEKTPEAETALLPKSLFPGEPPAIGDVCQFKVEHLFEDEVEVSYVKEGEGEENPPRKPSAMDDATDSFDKMAAPATTNNE